MPNLRKPVSAAWTVGIALAVLLAGYVGAYYAMVVPWGWIPLYPAAEYIHVRQKTARSLFAPVHWLDCRIRPKVWEPPDFVSEAD